MKSKQKKEDGNVTVNRILIAEDDRSIADAAALDLRYVGYEYQVFYDGAEVSASKRSPSLGAASKSRLIRVITFGTVSMEWFSPSTH